MEDDSLTSQSNTEIQFLQQVNECQQHLDCMEKLFLEFKRMPENEIHLMKSNDSLNDVLLKGCKSQCNSDKILCKEFSNSEVLNEGPPNASVESSNKQTCSPLTFVIQVPNSLLNTLKNKISNSESSDFLSQYPVKQLFRSKKRARIITSLQKIFKKKKSNASVEVDQRFTQNLQLLQFLKEKCETNISDKLQNSNSYSLNEKPVTKIFTENSSGSDCSTNAELNDSSPDLKNKQTFIFPITYNFNEKLQTPVKSTFTIQHEITPQTNINSCFHSVKIMNEMPAQDSKSNTSPTEKKTQIKCTKEEKLQTEMLLENLVKALHSTINRLDSLETINAVIEKLIREDTKQRKMKNYHQNNKDSKIKSRKESMAHLVQTEKERKKQIARILNKSDKQMPKKQSSKLSICSTSCTISSDDEPGKYSKLNRNQKHAYTTARCRSPSTFNYLVCQSERDIDQI